ncbi:hypothetical protein OfM1_14630 [Lactovum odontotermitis]
MTFKIEYADSALKDLIGVKACIEEAFLSEQAAKNTIDNIVTGLGKLKLFPEGGLRLSDRVEEDVELTEDYYFTFVGNHVAFYEISNKVVSTVRVLGMKQNWVDLLRKGR